jgi:hypothetical protein
MMDSFDLIGLMGVALMTYSYARVQWRRDYAKCLEYSVVNFVGSAFLIFSLLNKWNVASFVGNDIWALVSLYGIFRCLRYMRKKHLAFSIWHWGRTKSLSSNAKCQMPLKPPMD